MFRDELETLINKHSKENGSNTPDFILAGYLTDCLDAFDRALYKRDDWNGLHDGIAKTKLNNSRSN